MFNIKIKHIAYPFGTFESIDKKSLKLLSESYEFVHSGLRGNNHYQKNYFIELLQILKRKQLG